MKKIYYILFVLFSMLTFASCSNDVDEVFDKSSAERINEALANYKNVLTSAENGWLMKYYPKADTPYGGYSVFVKFGTDDNATVSSDATGADKAATSHFKLEQSSGPILSFDEYNDVMHYFSDPANPDGIGTNGKGMEGDLEFRILSATAEEVVMIGKKHGAKIVMTPVEDDVSYADAISNMLKLDDEMFYPIYNCTVGEATYSATVNYRVLIFSRTDADEDPVEAPYIVTKDGMEFYKPIVLNGDTIKGFKYVGGENNEFDATSSDVKMYGVIPPLSTQFSNGTWYFSLENMGAYSAAYWKACRDISEGDAVGETMTYAYLGTSNKGVYGFNFVSAGKYAGNLTCQVTPVDDSHVKLAFAVTGDANGIWYYSNAGYAYIIKALTENRTGVIYSIEVDNPKSPSELKLTDTSNPDNFYILSSRVAYYPWGVRQ